MDTYKGHPLESAVQGLGLFVPFLWWTYSWTDIALLLLFVNVRGMLRHDARATWLIGAHHLGHHVHPGKNFGEPWIDWLFRTGLRDP
jgi:sterol desaturase/sphingolipid hydroxylase (fatty acid hydroxylase superfamily)